MNWQDAYLVAWRFAAEAHQGQLFPGTDLPYIVHVSAVAMEVIAGLPHGKPDDAILAVQCALLHDVVEDANISLAEVEALFGKSVADGVSALSKDPELLKEAAMKDSLERIKEQPHEVWVVKLADRISNLQPPPKHWTSEKCSRYREEAKGILKSLGSSNDYLAKRLENKIDSYGEHCI
jgi:(p)ppGpp synthase/HD superfamily hydrolase